MSRKPGPGRGPRLVRLRDAGTKNGILNKTLARSARGMRVSPTEGNSLKPTLKLPNRRVNRAKEKSQQTKRQGNKGKYGGSGDVLKHSSNQKRIKQPPTDSITSARHHQPIACGKASQYKCSACTCRNCAAVTLTASEARWRKLVHFLRWTPASIAVGFGTLIVALYDLPTLIAHWGWFALAIVWHALITFIEALRRLVGWAGARIKRVSYLVFALRRMLERARSKLDRIFGGDDE